MTGPAVPIAYRVRIANADAHWVEVTLELDAPDPAGQRLTLPNWIPGSYMIRDFSRHVLEIHAEGSAGSIPLARLDKSSWQAPSGLDWLRVTMLVYAWEHSVREAYVDRNQAFLNGTSLFLCPEGRADEPVAVHFDAPAHPGGGPWKLATAMRALEIDARGFGTYRAEDYAELIDHPVQMSDFERLEFIAEGVAHELVLTGSGPFDRERLLTDLQAICDYQLRLFGAPAPVDRYVFLFSVVAKGYGGLEHRASTALMVARDSLPRVRGEAPDSSGGADSSVCLDDPAIVTGKVAQPPAGADESADAAAEETAGTEAVTDRIPRDERYIELLGLCSHEYFHTWNVKRIKPAVFCRPDLSTEVYTRLLWFFEGVTSYYDDLVLVRAGVIDVVTYLGLLAKTLTRVQRGAGRLRQSVTASSYEAWHKFYKQDHNAANAIVSYYSKGALVALCLDARMRQSSGDRISLDQLMQRAWRDWCANGQGWAERAPEELAAELLSEPLDAFFDQALYSTDELPLAESFGHLGVELHWRRRTSASDTGNVVAADTSTARRSSSEGASSGTTRPAEEAAVAFETPTPWLGADVESTGLGARLLRVASASPAERAGLAAGDIVVAIEHDVLGASSLDKLLQRYAFADSADLHYSRDGRLCRTCVPLEPAPLDTACLQIRDQTRLQAWLQRD